MSLLIESKNFNWRTFIKCEFKISFFHYFKNSHYIRETVSSDKGLMTFPCSLWKLMICHTMIMIINLFKKKNYFLKRN